MSTPNAASGLHPLASLIAHFVVQAVLPGGLAVWAAIRFLNW
jgi:hypothetical protein